MDELFPEIQDALNSQPLPGSPEAMFKSRLHQINSAAQENQFKLHNEVHQRSLGDIINEIVQSFSYQAPKRLIGE